MIAVRLLVDGVVVREAVFRDDAVTLGRGAESDFALVEPSVSRRHAHVVRDESGTVWIENAGSRNGLRVGGARVERAALPATGALRCQLGTAELELAIASPDTTLDLTAPPSVARGALPVLKAVALWAASVVAVPCGLMVNPGFWSPWEQDRLATLASATVGIAMGLPVLAFVLIGMLRIVRRRVGAGEALRALAVVSWAFVLLQGLLRVAAYALSVRAHGQLTSLLAVVATALSVAFLASTSRPRPRRRFFLAWAAAIALLMAGAAGAGQLAARQAGVPQLDYDLQPPVAGFSGPSADLDAYTSGLGEDFARAEQRAAEERRYSDAARR